MKRLSLFVSIVVLLGCLFQSSHTQANGIPSFATPFAVAGATHTLVTTYATPSPLDVVVPDKPLLIITAIDVPKPYGGVIYPNFPMNKNFTATGLQNGETIGSVTVNFTAGTNATDPPGVYAGSVVPSAATGGTFTPDNYTIVYIPGNLIISPAKLTIKVNNNNKAYGSTLTGNSGNTLFTATGLLNGETIGSISVAYTAGTAAIDAVGIYSNAAIGSGATGGTFNPAYYSINYLPGNVVVNPATLTVTADNKTKAYGTPNPVLTYTYNGFVNNESTAQLTTLPVISTTATLYSIEGQYAITFSGGAAANYVFAYVAGVLTITPPPPLNLTNTITPNGDGINDTWNIPALALYPNCTVTIYNRYGKIVYKSIGYSVAWDGKYKGTNVPAGVYYYVIDLKDHRSPTSGSLTVIR